MLVLGIETSGRAGSIALFEDGELRGSCELAATGRRHARTLIPEIGQLLASQSRTVRDLDGVAVSLGPGSFTGLRVGVVCAKMLAYALSIPVAGIDTFAAIALQSSEALDAAQEAPVAGCVWVIDDALRGEVFAGAYRVAEAGAAVITVRAPHIVDAEILKRQIQPEDVLTGPGIARFEPLFDECRCAPEANRLPQAATIAKLGWERLQQGDADDCWTLKPTYLRRSAAEEKADGEIHINV